MSGGRAVAHAELGVFADGECRARAITDENGVAYLTIPGDEAAVLSFKVAAGGEEAEASETLTYETDAIYGSPLYPMVIDLGQATYIGEIAAGDADGSIYDLQGRKLDVEKSRLSKGIYIINGKKQVVK